MRVFQPHQFKFHLIRLQRTSHCTKSGTRRNLTEFHKLGNLRVCSGLMDLLGDGELRFVIGHEMGHIALRYIHKKMHGLRLKGDSQRSRRN